MGCQQKARQKAPSAASFLLNGDRPDADAAATVQSASVSRAGSRVDQRRPDAEV
jgi:hypothetical protein